ncbi:MAG: spore germination protein, partial [Ruminiclostridium sp.]
MGKLAADLERNTINIKNLMDSSSDLTMKFGKVGGRKICIVFCEGLASTDTTADLIYRPLNSIGNEKEIPFKRLVEMVQDELLLAGEQVTVEDYDQLAQRIMSGFVIILIDGLDYGIGVGVQGYQARGIEEPSTHINLRGSREGFVEVIRTNISMVRRRMKTPDLVFNIQTIGDRSHTDICVCYLRDKVDKTLLAEVQKRIDGIELNTILESGYIQPFLEQKGDILFSEVGVTERPDTFAAKLYDGRVGILVDGTPFA